MPFTRRFLCLLALALLAGCGGRPKVLTVEEPGQPRTADRVTMLLEAPDRPHRTIALIRSPTGGVLVSLEDLKQMVREAAAEVGADAVILSFSSTVSPEWSVASQNGAATVTTSASEQLRIIGRAIVYSDR